MTNDHFLVLRACRRSRIKQRILHALSSHQELLVVELADIASTSPKRIHAAMHGDGFGFRFDTALVTLGVARKKASPRGDSYAITPHGRSAWRRVRPRLPRGSLRAERE